MAVNLNKKSSPSTQGKAAEEAPKKSFLKRGAAAKEAMANEEHKAEAAMNKTNRYWIEEGKDGSITFLDGDLDDDGVLDIPFLYEHNVSLNGKYGNFFACLQEEEPCPICEGGLSASYVGLLTVIDHSEYKSKRDGKTYKDQIRLFAAKRDTIKLLQKIATKRGGLAGCRFDVSRTGNRSPAVGSVFDYTEKMSAAQILQKYGEAAKPINYEEAVGLITFSGSHLRKMGFGTLKGGAIGSEPAPSEDDFGDKM